MISGLKGQLAECVSFWICLGGMALAGPSFTISSPAFTHGQPIPAHHALGGDNVSPELDITQVPTKAKVLVLIVDDPDAPSGLWTHWLVWNLPVTTASMAEGKLPPEAREGTNSFGHVRYDGPMPPSGTHRYFFRLYALDSVLKLPTGSERDAVMAAMEGHIVGVAETFGTYQAHP